MREPVGELAVVRQEQHAGRVGVEAADRDDPGLVADEADDGRAAARVARRRHDACRLVQQHVDELLQPEPAAVELDAVARLDERVQRSRLAVDGDPARLDQLVGAAPGRDTGAR